MNNNNFKSLESSNSKEKVLKTSYTDSLHLTITYLSTSD